MNNIFSGLEIAEVHDAGDLILMSGLVDSHVHVNEPGKEVLKGLLLEIENANLAIMLSFY
jgi:dihydroorotase-like cyclic amidohydrolase